MMFSKYVIMSCEEDGEPAGLYREYTTLEAAKLWLDIARSKYPENEYELYEKYQWKQ